MCQSTFPELFCCMDCLTDRQGFTYLKFISQETVWPDFNDLRSFLFCHLWLSDGSTSAASVQIDYNGSISYLLLLSVIEHKDSGWQNVMVWQHEGRTRWTVQTIQLIHQTLSNPCPWLPITLIAQTKNKPKGISPLRVHRPVILVLKTNPTRWISGDWKARQDNFILL